MLKSQKPNSKVAVAAAMLVVTLIPTSGCLHTLVATGIYLWDGGNVVPAACEDLDKQRVVVFCRPPASHEYQHAGAASLLAKRVGGFLANNVPGIDVVDQREVENWSDENDWESFKDLGRAVNADRVVHIELDHFDLFKGKTLYQGNAEVTVSVYDMQDRGRLIWDRQLGQILFPMQSGIPAQDKPLKQFQRDFVNFAAEQIAINFYKHDPHIAFAIDAVANH